MDEKEILSASLAYLLKIYPPRPEDLYYDGCFMGHREVFETEVAVELFRFPTRINAFGVVFCSKGSISITSDLRHCVVGSHDIFVCPPGTIIQVDSQVEASVLFILCEEEFINRIHIDMKQLLHLFMAVRENPCLSLNEAEWTEMIRSIDEIFSEGRRQRTDLLSTEIMNTLCRCMAYRLCRIIDDQIGLRSVMSESRGSSRDRSAIYFNAFIEELSRNYMQERSVGFYAERLHLTPKYLTTLLRTTTGRTATDWIDEYVILEAKNLLKYSSMNIQEIAYYLHFPNQSFFGKYFKQHTGMTPSAYRSSK